MLGDEVVCKYWPGGELTLFIDGMNVEGAGPKHAAWRNWANYVLVLLIWTIELDSCDRGLVGASGISHIQSDMLHLPVRMMFLFLSKT